ncbi:MAG TPA: transporter substrate-binding domain-containing protein [Burkholderiaceae bacterium]
MELRRFVTAAAIAATMVSLVQACAAAEPIVLFYVQRPPFMGSGADGKLSGFLIPPVTRAFAKAGIPAVWREASTMRQLTIIRTDAMRACSTGRYRTPDREAYARFSLSYYQDMPWVGVANLRLKTEDRMRAADLMADPNVSVLLKDDIKFGPYADDLIAHMKAKRIGTTSDFGQIIRLVQAGRADFTFISGEEESYYRKQTGSTDKDLKIIHFTDMPAGEKRYLMCSKSVSDAEMEKINAGLK